MTVIAEKRPKSSAALRKELDRHIASRETYQTEAHNAQQKLEAALGAGDDSTSLRMQTRLSGLQGLCEQQDRMIGQLSEELAEREATERRAITLSKLVALAAGAEQALQAVESQSAELNELLKKRVTAILDLQLSLPAKKLEFMALARKELGVDLGGFQSGDISKGNVLLRELKQAGANLLPILAYWGGTPQVQGERPYQAPELVPFGRNIYDLVGTLGNIRALEMRAAYHATQGGA